MVRRFMTAMLAMLALAGTAQAADPALPILRATFIAANPVQAFVDPATGRVRGPAVDLTRALAQQLGVPWSITGAQGVAGVIARVVSGEADIGFVAFDPLRAIDVDFSQAYSLSQNAYLVAAGSSLCCAADVDGPGVRIGVRKGDAGELFLTRTLRQAALVRDEGGSLEAAAKSLRDGTLSAYAANRHRLTGFIATTPGFRILKGDFYAVEQAVAVRKGNMALLGIVNPFLDRARTTGFIAASIKGAGLSGVDVAPAPAPARAVRAALP